MPHLQWTFHIDFVYSPRMHFSIGYDCSNDRLDPIGQHFGRSLYNPPTKLMDLKYFRSSAPPFLGTKVKNAAFKIHLDTPCSWNSLKRPIISFCTKCHLKYQKAMEKPSGPRAWFPHIPTKALTTSFEKGLSKHLTSSLWIDSKHISLILGPHSLVSNRRFLKAFANPSFKS